MAQASVAGTTDREAFHSAVVQRGVSLDPAEWSAHLNMLEAGLPRDYVRFPFVPRRAVQTVPAAGTSKCTGPSVVGWSQSLAGLPRDYVRFPFVVVDLFAGAGGSSNGIIILGSGKSIADQPKRCSIMLRCVENYTASTNARSPSVAAVIRLEPTDAVDSTMCLTSSYACSYPCTTCVDKWVTRFRRLRILCHSSSSAWSVAPTLTSVSMRLKNDAFSACGSRRCLHA
jgi:hypothetical protein